MPGRDLQLTLGLRPHYRWGGCRSGAGRKRGASSPVPHRPRAGVVARCPAHVTFRIRRGLPSLRTPALVSAVQHAFARACDRGDFRLVHYSLQHTHAHLLVEVVDAGALGRGMMAVGARLARAFNRVFHRSGAVLADRFHLHVLRTPREVRAALAYVLLNVRHHAQRFVRVTRLDPASSAEWFDGWRWKPPGEDLGNRPVPVARPRTWLLGSGWRRHGLLDPSEVPGPKKWQRGRQLRESPGAAVTRQPPLGD